MKRLPALALVLLAAFGVYAKNGAYKSTKHGAAFSCVKCHSGLHAAHDGQARGYEAGLFAPNDNDLCFTCHAVASESNVFPGSAFWQGTVHARSQNAAKCIDCHDPHGVKDAKGVIPAMLAKREDALCTGCHDGSHAGDVTRALAMPFRHEVACSNCHNPHFIDTSSAPPSAPQASNRLAGVSRIEVANGGAGLAPTYVLHGAGEPGAREYEICFKCHSSYVKQRPGQSNLALLTNPANPSYHPIQAPGKNARIDPQSFTAGYDAQSMIFCSDCHEAHGSSYRYLTKKPSPDLCLTCHAYDVYANTAADSRTQKASRFTGHALHAGRNVDCYTCHESHGSTRYAALITNRPSGIMTYVQTATGGSCSPTCHGGANYTASYPR